MNRAKYLSESLRNNSFRVETLLNLPKAKSLVRNDDCLVEGLIKPSPEDITHGRRLTAVVLKAVEEGINAIVHTQKALGAWDAMDDKKFVSTNPLFVIITQRILDMGDTSISVRPSVDLFKGQTPYEHSNTIREFFVSGYLSPETLKISIEIVPAIPLKLFVRRFHQDWRRISTKFQEIYFHELTHRIQFQKRALGMERHQLTALDQGRPDPLNLRIPYYGPNARERAREAQEKQALAVRVYGRGPIPPAFQKYLAPPEEHFYAKPAKSYARTAPASELEKLTVGNMADQKFFMQQGLMDKNDPIYKKGQDLPPRVSSSHYYGGQPEEVQAWATGVGRVLFQLYKAPEVLAYRSVGIRLWGSVEAYYPENTPSSRYFMRYLYEYLQRQGLTNQEILKLIHSVKRTV